MKTNESVLDRVIRVVVGLVMVALYAFGAVTGGLGVVLTIVGAVLVVTGAVGFCPLYALLKIQTAKK